MKSRWLQRLRATFARRGPDQELDAELESHLQLHIDDCVRRGMSPEAARREALLALGGVEATKEEVRAQLGLVGLESWWKDIVFAVRSLRRSPAFTALVVGSFAIGIGANTAIFAAVNTVLLRPLPYPD